MVTAFKWLGMLGLSMIIGGSTAYLLDASGLGQFIIGMFSALLVVVYFRWNKVI